MCLPSLSLMLKTRPSWLNLCTILLAPTAHAKCIIVKLHSPKLNLYVASSNYILCDETTTASHDVSPWHLVGLSHDLYSWLLIVTGLAHIVQTQV